MVGWLVGQKVEEEIGWSVGQLVGLKVEKESVGRPACKLVGWSCLPVSCLVSQSAFLPACLLVSRLIGG